MRTIDYVFYGIANITMWVAGAVLLSAFTPNPMPWIISTGIFMLIGMLIYVILFGVENDDG